MQEEHAVQLERKAEPGSSKRYKNFYSALQLATQSAASKWTYEDFKECFPTYCEEFPIKAQAIRSEMAKSILSVTREMCDTLLTDHNAAASTDILHEIVLEARARKQTGQVLDQKDLWTADLRPQSAVHARTIPILESERDHMLAELDKLAAENNQLINELDNNERQQHEYDGSTTQRLDALDEFVTLFESLPLQDMEQFGMDAEESLGSRN